MKRWHKAVAAAAIAATAGGAVYLSSLTRKGPADIYPASDIPGAVNAAITQANIGQTLCNPNWSTKSERPPASYTTALKIKQLAQYGYKDQNTKDYEEDHLISLELGGNPTSPQNLWPEPYTASIPQGGAKVKDTVENYLHGEICAGTITLQEAQREISSDWYAVYESMGSAQPTYGAINSGDPDDETTQ